MSRQHDTDPNAVEKLNLTAEQVKSLIGDLNEEAPGFYDILLEVINNKAELEGKAELTVPQFNFIKRAYSYRGHLKTNIGTLIKA